MFERKNFRKSLFGYSRADVSEYLSTLSEEFSERLLEQEQRSRQEIDSLRRKIEQLEADNRKLLDEHLAVANALLNAEKYNNYIKEAIEMEAMKIYDDIIAKAKQEAEKLNTYKQSIQQLKVSVQSMLERISAEADSVDRQAKIVKILDLEGEEAISMADDDKIKSFLAEMLQ